MARAQAANREARNHLIKALVERSWPPPTTVLNTSHFIELERAAEDLQELTTDELLEELGHHLGDH